MGEPSDFKESIGKLRLASKLASKTLESEFKRALDDLERKITEELKQVTIELDETKKKLGAVIQERDELQEKLEQIKSTNKLMIGAILFLILIIIVSVRGSFSGPENGLPAPPSEELSEKLTQGPAEESIKEPTSTPVSCSDVDIVSLELHSSSTTGGPEFILPGETFTTIGTSYSLRLRTKPEEMSQTCEFEWQLFYVNGNDSVTEEFKGIEFTVEEDLLQRSKCKLGLGIAAVDKATEGVGNQKPFEIRVDPCPY
jgi:hypothetical protein